MISFERVPAIDFGDRAARNKYIITGGPGFGITTLVRALATMKQATMGEAARDLIEGMPGRGQDILPWKDRDAFDRALRDQKMADYRSVKGLCPCFFDRGLPDFLGWRKYLGLPIDQFMTAIESCPYEKTVFMTTPWKEIYQRDASRPLSFEESSDIHEHLQRGYMAMGYHVELVPKTTPLARARFVLAALKNNQ